MIVRRFLIPLGLLAGAAALVLSCRDATPVGVDARTSVLLAGRHAQPRPVPTATTMATKSKTAIPSSPAGRSPTTP